MDIKIIELPAERWQEYRDLRLSLLKLFPQAYSGSYEESLQKTDQDWQAYMQKIAKAEMILFFAEVDGKLVGSTGAYFYHGTKEKHKASVVMVGVLPEYHGKGIGRMLMQAVMDRLEGMPQIQKLDLSVTTTQQAAIKLYESFGFVKVGEMKKELFVEGQYYDLYEMEKLLV